MPKAWARCKRTGDRRLNEPRQRRAGLGRRHAAGSAFVAYVQQNRGLGRHWQHRP